MKNLKMKIIRTEMKLFLLCLIFCGFLNAANEPTAKPDLLKWDLGCDISSEDLDMLLKSGNIKGYMDYTQFWTYYDQLQKKYPTFIGEKFKIGYTFEEQQIDAFFFGEKLKGEDTDKKNKNIILITALHHSREPMTVSMVIFLMVMILRERGVCGVQDRMKASKWEDFFRANVILFVPIVNIDSFQFISKNWKGPNEKEVLMIRKNRRVNPQCSIFDGGVDLNRNYDFMFAKDDQGSSPNPCTQDYRGTKPFSEPETMSIRNLVEGRGNIVSGVNMHSYGNAWVYPFNFINDSKNLLLKKKKPKFYQFYESFGKELAQKNLETELGNAQATVEYSTNGEAGDWLVGKENILNLDVELGDLNTNTDKFYPEKELIMRVCQFNYNVFREFFWRHNTSLILRQVKRNLQKKKIVMTIYNNSISSLIGFELEVIPEFLDHSTETQPRTKLKTQTITSSKISRNNKDSSNWAFPLANKPNRKLEVSTAENTQETDSKERLLTRKCKGKVKMSYSLKSKNREKSKEIIPLINGKISTTLRGWYFLDIILEFEKLDDLRHFKRLNTIMTYNDDHKQEFVFYLSPENN